MMRMLFSPLFRTTRARSLVSLAGLLLLVSGCAGTADLDRMSQFQDPYARGDYAEAAAMLGGDDGLNYDAENLLTSLQVGAALRASGSFEASQTAFDRAESQVLWKADEISDVGEFLEAGLSIVGNDLISSYHGNIYDGVLINTYKAMNALHLGDADRARVELNRADQRQENAVHQLAAKVKALAVEDSEEAAERQNQSSEIDQTYSEATKPGSELGQRLAAVRGLGKYKDLRNPFTDWFHGTFRLATGEANRASDLFRNAVVLDGERNKYVKEDFRIAEEAAGDVTGATPRRVWIVHEDGVGPRLDEFRYELPVFSPGGYIYAGIAVPEFVTGTPGVSSLFVEADGATYRTEALLNVDRYAATEFEAGYDAIIGKAVASAVIKVIAQIAADQAAEQIDDPILGMLVDVGTSMIAEATTQADTRMWRALPQSINIASMPWPEDDRIQISAGGGPIADIQLPSANFVIVTVKTVSSGAPAAVHVAALSGSETLMSQVGDPVARPALEFVEASDAPTVRSAVMESVQAPDVLRAENADTQYASGHTTLAGVENPVVVRESAEQFASNSLWWKPHVSVDRTLRRKGLRKLAFGRAVNAGGFVRVVGKFLNVSDRKLSTMYKFTWLDAQGRPIESTFSGWQVVHALPGAYAQIQGIAPRDDIAEFHLELISVS